MTEINTTTMDNTAEVAQEITESVVEKAGTNYGKAAGIVGGAILVGLGVYGAVKYFKNKKSKDEAGEETTEVVDSEEVEETEETAK